LKSDGVDSLSNPGTVSYMLSGKHQESQDMNEHKFKAFLLSRRRQWNENQSKKFVDHALDDPDLPDAKSWEELEAYLKGRPDPASAATIEEAKYIWGLYEAEARGKTD
jgi:hypothetical protein